MKPNPKLNALPLSNTERLMQLTAVAVLVFHIGLVAVNYTKLPDRIPIHFGLDGQPDGWGDKWVFLILLGVTVGMFALMRFITTIGADKYNYPVTITPKNREKQYQLSRQLIFMMNAGMMVLFLLITWGIIQTAHEQMNGLGNWFWLAIVGLVFLPIGYTLLESQKYK